MLQAIAVSYFQALLSESHLEEHCEKIIIDQACYKIDGHKIYPKKSDLWYVGYHLQSDLLNHFLKKHPIDIYQISRDMHPIHIA